MPSIRETEVVRGWLDMESLAPFRLPQYRVFWAAAFFSNLGTWVHEIGAQWLMPMLDSSPVMVSSVRTAVALPVFLMCLPAGVIADRWDRRKLLIGTQAALALIALAMAALTWAEAISPVLLLTLSFLMGLGMAIHVPTWQSVVPEIVPKDLLPAAIGLGSISFNMARSVGPALGGYLVARYSAGAAFLLNAISFVGVIAVLIAWRRSIPNDMQTHQHEPFFQSMATGIRYVFSDRSLRHCLAIAALYVFPASVIWSLLPLIVKELLRLEAVGFGFMVGLFGAGAVSGALILPWLRRSMGSNNMIVSMMTLSSIALVSVGVWPTVEVMIGAMLSLGLAWMSVLTTLQATAQINLPNTHRARGMSTYLMTFSLTMATGSLVWGMTAQKFGLCYALLGAALVMFVGAVASLRFSIGKI
jgi:predicted MFS family arabinose efflux permease